MSRAVIIVVNHGHRLDAVVRVGRRAVELRECNQRKWCLSFIKEVINQPSALIIRTGNNMAVVVVDAGQLRGVVEEMKPKSWLKSMLALANAVGVDPVDRVNRRPVLSCITPGDVLMAIDVMLGTRTCSSKQLSRIMWRTKRCRVNATTYRLIGAMLKQMGLELMRVRRHAPIYAVIGNGREPPFLNLSETVMDGINDSPT